MKIKAIMYFAKFLNAIVKPRNLNFSRNKLYIWNLQITHFKMICQYSKSLKFFRTSKNGLNSDYFAKIAHKIAKSKYFSDILNESDSDKFPFQRYIICWGTLSLSKTIGGGAPHTAASFHSAKLCT